MPSWPEWWLWEIELSPHLFRRMKDRGFNETDIRLMLEDASGYHKDVEEGRWIIETMHEGRSWEIVVEPILNERMLVVVTAYRVQPGVLP